ncbi:2-keto-3-deoxygluconate kinase [Paenibacillus sp. MMS18-CY102]|uniref:2-keto-3-deoxygluconate kinase n=1 Tax=Paenibacillus sp. MMS18-CY102 TaxID=2682849 RepID=UPI0013652452|nr:2-keto-3-deoxygluconate kinase [Paenibacillus sp. MMS18-CY102]MWC29696.1 2-keto-3-deoxygluconate kinase [Paenibacillus sp. MMS18-CY102]
MSQNESNETSSALPNGNERDSEHRRRGGHGGREGRLAAQTFRRGRALAFHEMLAVKRDTLRKQLQDTGLQAIHQAISGELKAVEDIIAQYVHAFELHELSEE